MKAACDHPLLFNFMHSLVKFIRSFLTLCVPLHPVIQKSKQNTGNTISQVTLHKSLERHPVQMNVDENCR